MSAAVAFDVSPLDGHQADWRILCAHRLNVVLEGAPSVTEVILRRLRPHMREPTVWHQPRTRLDLPTREVGAYVLRDVGALSIDDQRRLLAWMGNAGSRTQIISTAARPVFALVTSRVFDAMLYYRLNVMLLRIGTPDQPELSNGGAEAVHLRSAIIASAAAHLGSIRSLPKNRTAGEADRTRTFRHLRELIAALDRRLPHIERAGEIEIASDAASLRARAVARIAELEAASRDR